MKQVLLKNCKELLTMDGGQANPIGLKSNVCVLIEDERIKKVDTYENIKSFVSSDCAEIDCSKKVVLPGYVDSHTHLIFGESRVEEYVLGLTKTKSEIKQILGRTGLDLSIYYTKNATDEELIDSSLEKLNRMLKSGTTTVEIKSGYGIDKDTELRQLRLIKKLKSLAKQTILATYLGAHYYDVTMGKEKYIDFMISEVMPVIQQEGLAEFNDGWCDDGYYTAEDCRKILSEGLKFGLIPTLHTECYSAIGGAQVVAELGGANAGHLNYLTEEDAQLMKEAGVVGILIPTTDFTVKHHKPFDMELIRKSGIKTALATNLNPGNWVESMSISIQLGCRNHGMTVEEALYSATMGGAEALRLEKEYGSITEGKYADIQILNTSTYNNIAYKIGVNEVETVIKKGQVVV